MIEIAEVEKFTDDGVMMLLKHSDRELTNDSNQQIIDSKKDLNYSIQMDTNGITPREYYKQIVGDSYLYGRGTKREAEAITACGWVITLPKEISDYSEVGKNEMIQLHPIEEAAFFKGAFDFVNERYPGCVFYNKVHYDEGGQPHIHIYFVPRLDLDHDQVQYKTINTHKAFKTESGRYQFEYKFKLDNNGNKIPLKNYAKMSDYYDYKISGADILNKAELQHFHGDFAVYLRDHNLPGANTVYTGKTGGKNVSVKALKEFTRATGIKIDELKQHPIEPERLKEMLDAIQMNPSEKKVIESINKDATIEKLQEKVYLKDSLIQQLQEKIQTQESKIAKISDKPFEVENQRLKEELSNIKKAYQSKELQLQQSQQKVKELETKQQELKDAQHVKTWDAETVWGKQSGWGNKSNTIHVGEDN